jgi:hypothetical protein
MRIHGNLNCGARLQLWAHEPLAAFGSRGSDVCRSSLWWNHNADGKSYESSDSLGGPHYQPSAGRKDLH